MADANVKILITAVDKASSVIKGMTSGTGKLGDAFKSLTGFSLGAAGGIALAGKAMQSSIKLVKDSIKETVAYNKTIREMSQVTGLNIDSISRIIQVGDDWGISIEAIRSSLAFMNKQGVTPSIDRLADLADEYVATTDKSAFAEKAVKLLGRGYQTLIPLLALGGKGFREATAAIDDNLIATDKSMKESRDYEVAVDDLTDSWQGFKYQIGREVIPILSDLMGSLSDSIKITKDITGVTNDLRMAMELGVVPERELAKIRRDLRTGTITLADAQKIYEDATRGVFDAATMDWPEEQRLLDIRKDLLGPTNDLANATNNVAMAIIDLNKAAMGKEMIDALNQAFIDGTISEDEYRFQMTKIMGTMLEMDAQSIITTIKMSDLKKQLDDGKITALEYANAVRALYDSLSALDGTEVETTIYEHHITTREERIVGQTVPGTPKQHGANFIVPPGYPNDSYPLGYAESGEHVIVIPKSQVSNNSFTMNVNTNAKSSTLMRDFNFMRQMAG